MSGALDIGIGPILLSMGIMFGAYVLAERWKFYSLVDVVWAYSFPVIALYYVLILPGLWARKVALLLIVSVWGVRLGTHLLVRLRAHFPTEDSRYAELRTKWAKNLHLNFLLFFLFQGMSVVILSLPFLLMASSTAPFHWLEFLGIAIWLTGILGEATADRQLREFKLLPENKGKVCAVGLWRYSRHPNYFFEWVIWVGFFVTALPAPMGILGLMSPAIMLYLLLKVTGVPYAEASSLKSRGDAYREYQKTTNAFFPWRPKSHHRDTSELK